MGQKAELREQARAIRAGWPVTDDMRAHIVDRAVRIALDTPNEKTGQRENHGVTPEGTKRAQLRAMDVVLKATAQNIALEQLDAGIAPAQTIVNVDARSVSVSPSRLAQMSDEELDREIEIRERQRLEAASETTEAE